MLKLSLIRWKAKCSRHPRFDPDIDGAGAIPGNCARCHQLQTIYESHTRILKLIRAFGPSASLKRVSRNTQPAEIDRHQLMLFSDPKLEREESAKETGG